MNIIDSIITAIAMAFMIGIQVWVLSELVVLLHAIVKKLRHWNKFTFRECWFEANSTTEPTVVEALMHDFKVFQITVFLFMGVMEAIYIVFM